MFSDKTKKVKANYVKKNKYSTYVFAAGMVILSFILFKRCFYGFAHIDEALYLQIPYRLVQGDALFADEWHISQLSAFIVYPFISLFRTLNGGTEGIMLFFRIMYMAAQLAATVVIWFNLKKYSEIGAVITAFLFYIYVPFGIGALSYNSMGIIFLSLGLVLFALSENKVANFIAGIFFAFAVLCCPYLVWIYAIYAVCVLIKLVFKFNIISEDLVQFKKAIVFTAGIAVAALAFIIFVFSRITLQQLLQALPYIMSDPTHGLLFKDKVWQYFEAILTTNKYTFTMCCGYAVVTLAALVVKNKKFKDICFMIFAVITALHIYSCAVINAYINHLMLPVNYLALFCYLVYRPTSVKKFFEAIFVPGVIYTICLHFTSNQTIYAISSAAAVAMVGGIVIIVKTAQERLSEAKIHKKALFICVLLLVFAIQGRYVLHYRWNAVFWDADVNSQTVLLEEGAYKGIYVTESKQQEYNYYMQEFEKVDGSERVLLLTDSTWAYSLKEWKVGSFSTWIYGVNDESMEKLDEFYAINPDRMPDTIFVESMYADFADRFEQKYGYSVYKVTDAGNIVMKNNSINQF